MPPSVQAVAFVFTEIWSTQQLEAFICTFAPEGIPLVVLQAALATPPFDQTSYGDQLIDLAVRLVLNGHQRSPGQILQEMRALFLPEPLPPIEVRIGAFTTDPACVDLSVSFAWYGILQSGIISSPLCPVLDLMRT
jgi:hypothetical protein